MWDFFFFRFPIFPSLHLQYHLRSLNSLYIPESTPTYSSPNVFAVLFLFVPDPADFSAMANDGTNMSFDSAIAAPLLSAG